MDKYMIFSLIALSVSLISLAFCGFGLWYMVTNSDNMDKQLLSFTRYFFKKGRKRHDY